MSAVRTVVEESWRRSVAAGLRRDIETAPLVLDDDGLQEIRRSSPLAPALAVIEEVLAPAARDCDAVVAVFDPIGRMIWTRGTNSARRRAEQIGFVEGSLWDERLAGTNAPGMALALNQPAEVRGSEHFRESVQTFGCVAAPIRDPLTGSVAGVVDLTGFPNIVLPQTLAAVVATARLAGTLLVPAGLVSPWSEPRTAQLRIIALGRDRAVIDVRHPGEANGRQLELSPRHSEILVLLAEHPHGLTGDELAVGIYPDEVATSTLRAELTRLKVILGGSMLSSRPYQLQADVRTDWRDAMSPHSTLAPREYPGPLLPRSQAPSVIEVRDRVHYAVRQRILDLGDLDTLAKWTMDSCDDYEAWQAIHRLAPAGSPLRSLARGQLTRLDDEYG